MSFIKLVFKPGINRDQTNYSGEGGWSDCDKVRFFSGFPQKLGGWLKTTPETFIGVCRQVWNWITSFTDNFLGVGTDIKLYIEVGGQFYDITPLRATTAAGDVTFAALTPGSSTITVSNTAHGALAGDYVTFSDALTLSGGVITGTIAGTSTGTATFTTVSQTSTSGDGYGADFTISSDGAGAYTLDAITAAGNAYAAADTLVILGTDLGGLSPANDATITVTSVTAGNITAAVLNQNYVVTSKIDDDSFTISAKDSSTGAAVTANALDTGDGGSATVGAYEIHPGYPLTTEGYGWGASAYSGSYGWDLGGPTPIDLLQRDWFMDNFDNDLVANIRRGPIYYWERGSSASPATALGTRAVLLSSLSGNDSVPTLAMQVTLSQNDKHLLAFGCQPYAGGATDFDPLLIRWASQDEPQYWNPTGTTPGGAASSAGFLRVSRGSEIVATQATRQEILVWTDTTLYSLQFTGTTDVFALQQLADNISIISPRAAATANNVTYWMGTDKFYVYSGQIQTLPTTVREYVYKDINFGQSDQIVSGTNEGFNEVWWFYPSAESNWNDRYVIYNHLEQVWYYGSVERTAWLDTPLRDVPTGLYTEQYTYAETVAGTPNSGNLYQHEVGVNDDESAMTCFIQSNDFDLAEGDQFMLTRRIIPDINFNQSTAATPGVTFEMRPRNFPGSAYSSDPSDTQSVLTTSANVNVFTDQVFIRARARQMALKIASDTLDVQWQLGSPRLDVRPDGRR
jgi:hypothetical protein